MKVNSSVKKWDNSLAVRIPSSIIQDLELSENSGVQIVSNFSPQQGHEQAGMRPAYNIVTQEL